MDERFATLINEINMIPGEIYAEYDLTTTDALNLINYSDYFKFTNSQVPEDDDDIMLHLLKENIVTRQGNGLIAVTDEGALAFAKSLARFRRQSKKGIRVIQYEGGDRAVTRSDNTFNSGYACGFEKLNNHIVSLLPTKGVTEGSVEMRIPILPPPAIRELIANTMVHQDLSLNKTGPLVEVFDDRIEFTNPGKSLIDPKHFVDSPPLSRNEDLVALMQKVQICKDSGSGWDTIALYCEKFCIPAPKIDLSEDSTKITLFSYIPFNEMSLEDKLRTCYEHACLKQVNGQQVTNASLRKRFLMLRGGHASIYRLITTALEHELIKPFNPDAASWQRCYIPYWADL